MKNVRFPMKTLAMILPFTLLLAASLISRESADPGQPPRAVADVDFSTWIDANSILMFVTNKGSFAYDNGAYFGKYDGFYFPFTGIDDIFSSANALTALYSGGLWVGAVDSASGDTLVTTANYGTDWGVGPIVGDSSAPGADANPVYRVYKLHSDSLVGNPNQDYLDWPSSDGAPLEDGAPQMHGDQMLWAVFNDLNADAHTRPTGTSGQGLGVEVHQTVWAFAPGAFLASEYMLYIKFKLINKGDKTLENFVVSLWFDPDVGDASDDFVGCDTLNDVFFCYNADPDDADYGITPPAVGGQILQGPIVPSPGDTAYVDGRAVPNHKNLKMESFCGLMNPYDPDNFRESYRVMNGLQLDGSPLANGTRYYAPGDPVTGSGDLDTSPGDRRMMANVGSFTFRPGDVQQVVVRLAGGQATSHLSSLTELRAILDQPYNIPTDVDDPSGPDGLPADYALEQNYPNPFNPATTIEYSLPTRSEVTISIYNILGQEVKTLVNAVKAAGDHVARWDGTDRTGERVASGVYFYRIEAGNFVSSKKMLLLK